MALENKPTSAAYKPDVCVYHGACDDGFAAAWAVWKRWPDCKFIPGLYGKEPVPEQLSDKRVLMVDFSYKREVLDALDCIVRDMTIIDHHKTAQADLETFAIFNPVSADDIDEVLAATQPGLGPIRAWFDMQQSGAMMAWKFTHPGALIPHFIELIQDRDLWKFEFGENTKQFSASLRTYPMEFEVWDRLIHKPQSLINDGEAILRAHNANIEKFIKEVYDERIGDHVVPVVNVPYHYASDTAHAMLQAYPHAPFAACWFHRGDGMIQYSLRSEDSRVDVSEVAKQFGGGGHRNAAGYQVKA
jgi:oligoribonuclease NrnB/cAMP/cGMP phosphodiesterase (DHH superfamily)